MATTTLRSFNRENAIRFLADLGMWLVLLAAWGLVIGGIISLGLADLYVGKITGEHISNDPIYGFIISCATSALVMGAIAFFAESRQRDWHIAWTFGLGVAMAALMGGDAWLDSMSVDISRFGAIVFTGQALVPSEALAHNIYRILVAGISLIGEPISTITIAFFPTMKEYVLRSIRSNAPSFGSSNKPYRPDNSRPDTRHHSNQPIGAHFGGQSKPKDNQYRPAPKSQHKSQSHFNWPEAN